MAFGACGVRIDRDRQRDRETLVAEDALDFALHIVRKLARAELGEIDAIAGAEPANLAFVVRTLRRVAAHLIDEAVPNVDIDDACLLGPAAIELVKVGQILARLCAALRSETNPDHRNTGAFECRNGGVDALDVGELPLFRVEFPGAVGRLARLFQASCGDAVLLPRAAAARGPAASAGLPAVADGAGGAFAFGAPLGGGGGTFSRIV